MSKKGQQKASIPAGMEDGAQRKTSQLSGRERKAFRWELSLAVSPFLKGLVGRKEFARLVSPACVRKPPPLSHLKYYKDVEYGYVS